MSRARTSPPKLDQARGEYERACEAIRLGQEAIALGGKILGKLTGGITDAHARGLINQKIWETRRIAGKTGSYFSQSGQDAFLDQQVFRKQRGGTFVEIGGYDGITGSNCLFFELLRSWSGVLIEPSPAYFQRASEFRRCKCLKLAVAETDGKAEFLHVREGYRQMSGLVASYPPGLRDRIEADPRFAGEVIEVEARTLDSVLTHANLQRIDYISLDVEGAELAVLQGFPFGKYEITAWTIENNMRDPRIKELMARHGYKLVEALGVDDVFVRG